MAENLSLCHVRDGLVKYLKFDLVASYCFKALHTEDLVYDKKSLRLIDDIVLKCNSL